MKHTLALFALIALFGCLSAEGWVLDGESVYWSENGRTISATPAISYGIRHTQYVNFSSTNPSTVTANYSFVFDQPISQGKAYLWRSFSHDAVEYTTLRGDFSLTLYNITTNTSTTDPCEYGDAQNAFKRRVNTINSTQVICYNSFSGAGTTFTAYYQANYTGSRTTTATYPDWDDISATFIKTTIGQKTVFTRYDVELAQGDNHQLKFVYNTEPGDNGKYDIYIHRCDAMSAYQGEPGCPIYVALDPWFNSSFAYKVQCNFTQGSTGDLTNFPGFCTLNTTALIAAGKMQGDCDDLMVVNSSETGQLYSEVEACNHTYFNSTIWFLLPSALSNATTNTVYLYYGAPSATSMHNKGALWNATSAFAVYHGDTWLDSTDTYNNTLYEKTATVLVNYNNSYSTSTQKCRFSSCFLTDTNGLLYTNTTAIYPANSSNSFFSGWVDRNTSSAVANYEAGLGGYGGSSAGGERSMWYYGADPYYMNYRINQPNPAPTIAYAAASASGYWAGGQIYGSPGRGSIRRNATVAYSNFGGNSAAVPAGGSIYLGAMLYSGAFRTSENCAGTGFCVLDEVRYYSENKSDNWALAEWLSTSSSGPEILGAETVSVAFVSQTPSDLTSLNVVNSPLRVQYNITSTGTLNDSLVLLYYKTNNTLNDISAYHNGTADVGWETDVTHTNASGLYNWSFGDNEVYPHTENIQDSIFRNMGRNQTALSNQNSFFITGYLNVSNTTTYGFYEQMWNSSTAAGVRIYACNNSYNFTSQIPVDPYCVQIASVVSNGPYDHTHNNSGHRVVPFVINSTTGTIAGSTVKVSPTMWFAIRGNNGATVNVSQAALFTRTGAIRTTINAGTSWTNQTYTSDGHLHQYYGNDTFHYYVCANATTGEGNCSAVRSDNIDLAGLPPSAPVISSPTNQSYQKNLGIWINYSASQSPNGYPITYYNITLRDSNNSIVSTIRGNNSINLSYLWDATAIADGQYIVGVKATDNESQSTVGTSDFFTLFSFATSNGSATQVGTASLSSPPMWSATFTVTGVGTCNYTIPKSGYVNGTVLDTSGTAVASTTNTSIIWGCLNTSSPYTVYFNTENITEQVEGGISYSGITGSDQVRILIYTQYANGISYAFNYTPGAFDSAWLYTCGATTNASCKSGSSWTSTSFAISSGVISKTVTLSSNETVLVIGSQLGGGGGGGSIPSGGSIPGPGTPSGGVVTGEGAVSLVAPIDEFMNGSMLGIKNSLLSIIVLGYAIFLDMDKNKGKGNKLGALGIISAVGIVLILAAYGLGI